MTATSGADGLSVLQADRIAALRVARAGRQRLPFAQVCPITLADVAERLDPGQLGQAVQAVARANGALQAAITDDGGAQCRTDATPALYELTLPNGFVPGDHAQEYDIIDGLARYEFPWQQPMADVGWAIGENRTILVLRADQLISDLRSIQLFFRALSEAYSGSATPAPDYFGLVRSENDWLAGPGGRAEQDFWAAQLAGADLPLLAAPLAESAGPAETTGPGTAGRAGTAGPAGSAGPAGPPEELAFRLGSTATRSLQELGRAAHVTIPTVLLVCLASELARHADQAAIAIPLRFARRERPEVTGAIMWRDAHLPVIVPASGHQPLSEVLRATQRSSFQALAHQRLAWPTIVASVPSWGGADPLTRSVSLHYLPAPMLASPDVATFAGADAALQPGPPCPSGAAVDIVALEQPSQIRVAAFYDPARMAGEQARRLGTGLERAVGNLLRAYQRGADPPISALRGDPR
jgi:hypothetical protein